jgi:sugar phosphate permease
MSPISGASPPRVVKTLYFVAWLLCALFYLHQYAARSAPGVMQDQLTAAWGGNHIGSMISADYVAYALSALAAGVLVDRHGAVRVIPYAEGCVGAGCAIFVIHDISRRFTGAEPTLHIGSLGNLVLH